MRRSTLLIAILALIVLVVGGAFVLSFSAKPTVTLVEKVFPDERFPRQ